MTDLIGRTLGQYHIIEQIGQGGMSTVYKSYQSGLNRYVAVKVLPPVHAKQPGFSERFQREAEAIANLHHPNILPVYDCGQKEGYSFIVMRYIEGARTRDRFNQWELGVNYWPHEDVVIKADYRNRDHDLPGDAGRNFDAYDLGIGYQF